MLIDNIAFFGDSFCADFEDSYIESLSKDYNITHMGYHGTGLTYAVDNFRNFLNNNNLSNTFFVFCNSARVRKQIQHPNGERPLPFSNDPGIEEDFSKKFIQAISLHEIYIQNHKEDLRNYLNALEAQQWLIHKFKIKYYKRFLCFKSEANVLNCPLNFFYDNTRFSNLVDLSCYFEKNAHKKPEYKNHFSPQGNKAMDFIIREAINEHTN